MKRVKSSFLSKILKNLFNEVISILVIYVKSSVMRAHCMYRVSSSQVTGESIICSQSAIEDRF